MKRIAYFVLRIAYDAARITSDHKTKSLVNEVNQQPPCPPFPLNKGGQGVVLMGTKALVSEANIIHTKRLRFLCSVTSTVSLERCLACADKFEAVLS